MNSIKAYHFLLIAFIVLAAACNSYGKKLTFNEGELYYTKNVTEEEANRLGNFLVDDGFFSGQVISVQLDKSADTYLFRMVSKDNVETDEKFISLAENYTHRLSVNVFDGAPVNFHFTDDQFKTKKEIPYTQGTTQREVESPASSDTVE